MKNSSSSDRIDLVVRLSFVVAILIGIFFVIKPFLTAIVLAAVLAVVTWPLFQRARNSLGDTRTPAAILMIFLIIIGIVIPSTILTLSLAQQAPRLIVLINQTISAGISTPDWIQNIPTIGPWIYDQLTYGLTPEEIGNTVKGLIDPISNWLMNTVLNVSNALFQLALVTFIVFFFYRDGAWFADRVKALLEKVSGSISAELATILVNTTRSVVFGLVGTALGQALVAGLGFWIAGVPGILILSLAIFLLSVVPIGPPLIWLPAAGWLYSNGDSHSALFLVLWGTFAISSVDNFLKPLLIARGSSLPIALVFLGVIGGVMSFGFLGLILGPLLLAIGIAIFKAWLKNANLVKKVLKATPSVNLFQNALKSKTSSDKPDDVTDPSASKQPRKHGHLSRLKKKERDKFAGKTN